MPPKAASGLWLGAAFLCPEGFGLHSSRPGKDIAIRHPNYKTVFESRGERLALAYVLFAVVVVIASVATLRGQDAKPTASTPPEHLSTPSSLPEPTPIPLAEVVSQAEAISNRLNRVNDFASDPIIKNVEAELSTLVGEIDARLIETDKILNSRPSLETLRNLESEWKPITDRLTTWKSGLTERASNFDREIARLVQLDQTWTRTFSLAEEGMTKAVTNDQEQMPNSATPVEIRHRMQTVIAEIRQTREVLEQQRARVLKLQNHVAEQGTRAADGLVSIRALARRRSIAFLLRTAFQFGVPISGCARETICCVTAGTR